jgi:hypothetical protein
MGTDHGFSLILCFQALMPERIENSDHSECLVGTIFEAPDDESWSMRDQIVIYPETVVIVLSCFHN